MPKQLPYEYGTPLHHLLRIRGRPKISSLTCGVRTRVRLVEPLHHLYMQFVKFRGATLRNIAAPRIVDSTHRLEVMLEYLECNQPYFLNRYAAAGIGDCGQALLFNLERALETAAESKLSDSHEVF